MENISQQVLSLSQLINPSIKPRENTKQIFLLAYKSKIGPDFNGRKSIKEIHNTAMTYNAKHEISGLLLFSEDQFLQIIEGEPFELVKLYQLILQDSRNKENKLLWFIPISNKIFSNWTMLVSDMHHEIFNQCNKILSAKKKHDANFLINSLDWLSQLAIEYQIKY